MSRSLSTSVVVYSTWTDKRAAGPAIMAMVGAAMRGPDAIDWLWVEGDA